MLADGDGRVTVQVEPVLLFINHVSVDATLKSAVLVTGALVVTVPLVLNVPVVKVNPVPNVFCVKNRGYYFRNGGMAE